MLGAQSVASGKYWLKENDFIVVPKICFPRHITTSSPDFRTRDCAKLSSRNSAAISTPLTIFLRSRIGTALLKTHGEVEEVVLICNAEIAFSCNAWSIKAVVVRE